ncbi:unnamed protein product, partial [Cylicocyclus nassatus]
MTGGKDADTSHAHQYTDMKWVSALSILIILLNVIGNVVKIFDSRFLWPFTLPSYVLIQTVLIVCELTITAIVYASADSNEATSFHADLCYIAILIAFMETTAYVLHRSIRTQEYDAMKKSFQSN